MFMIFLLKMSVKIRPRWAYSYRSFASLDGLITRLRFKKIKEAMQGLVQSTWDEVSKSPTLKMGLKEREPILIHLIQAVEDMT